MSQCAPHFQFYMDIHPGEHVLSLLGRHHQLSSYRLFNRSAALITDDIVGLSPAAYDRPAYRDLFRAMTDGSDKGHNLLEQHTLYNFYHPFVPECLHRPTNFIEKAVFPEQYRTFNHSQTWRWCNDCVNDDIEHVGFPYFHIEHQLPAMSRCYKHSRELISSCNHCHTEWKKIDKITIPPEDSRCLNCRQKIDAPNTYYDEDVEWLQRTNLALLSGQGLGIDATTLRAAYQDWLGVHPTTRALNIMQRNRVSDAQRAIDDFFDPGFYRLVFSNTDQGTLKRRSSSLSLYKAVFNTDKFISPIAHLLIIRAAFGCLESITQGRKQD